MSSFLTAVGISKRYGDGEGSVLALDDISFALEKGSLTIVLGPSGAGKTTLLNILGGMDRPTAGILAVDGKNVAAYTQKQRAAYRRNNVGFVFQFYNLVPCLDAVENILLSTEISTRDVLDAEQALISVGLGHRLHNYPAELSGGEQQRVSIARALAKNPDLLLCDEPTGALDVQTGKDILRLLANAAYKDGKAVVIVTHNSALQDLGDHIIRIKNGTIIEDDPHHIRKDIEDIQW